jgi:hypothetical protein
MMMLHQLATIAGATLIAALIPTLSMAKERERCESNVVIEKVGERPSAGSGFFHFAVEITVKTSNGERWPVYVTYFGKDQHGVDQRIPTSGTVCRMCYIMRSISRGPPALVNRLMSDDEARAGGFVQGRLVTHLSCNGVTY